VNNILSFKIHISPVEENLTVPMLVAEVFINCKDKNGNITKFRFNGKYAVINIDDFMENY